MQNTNKIDGRALGPLQPNARAQDWTPFSVPELRSYLGILIYMGVHEENRIEDYWSTSQDTLFHIISKYMSLRRFQILHRKIRISDLYQSPDLWSQVSTFPY